MKRIELKGKKIGKLTIISEEKGKNGRWYCNCKCDCGNECRKTRQGILYLNVKDCGCESRKKIQEVGFKNRKYKEECTNCGKKEHYALGYCRVCYNRYLRTGSPDRKELKVKFKIKLNEEQKELAKDIIIKNATTIKEKKLIHYSTLIDWEKGIFLRPSLLKKVFDDLGINIYSALNIEDKYKDTGRYRF